MKKLFCVLCAFILGSAVVHVQAQSFTEKLEKMDKYPGYFTFYWEESTGKILLEIDKLDVEFLYVNSLSAGLGSNDIGLDRSQLGGTQIVKFHRIGPKILLISPNYSFRATSDSAAERKAVDDGFARSVIWGFQVDEDSGGRVYVDASTFFMQDTHDVIGTLRRSNQGNYRLDMTRSAFYLPNTKNFPKNTEVEALLTFTSDSPGGGVRGVSPDAGAITVRQHHSFIELPDDNYKPRMFDPRSNFSGISYMDFATPIDQPLLKRFTNRHRIFKKDPSAKISEPVEPIVYYIDNSAPEPILSALLEGASWWNQAFEAIGYKDAFLVKILPEGADPMDIRYNMVNWIHRSTRGWSYGSSVTDPRTGEILKGHVALGSQRIRQDFLIASGLIAEYEEGKDLDPQIMELALARVRQLSAHEIGHTLGMGHNYAASVNDRASVMDYPHPLIKITGDGKLDLSDAYDVGIGKWDIVSINFGYQDFPKGVDEEKELNAILDNAFSSGLYFLAGQDAGESSAHPLANVWDSGTDPVDELDRVMKIRAIALRNFTEKRIPIGAPMATLEEALVPTYLFHRYQVEAASSKLGGLYYNHTLRGDTQKSPFIVPADEQRQALDSLLNTISPENLAIDEKLLSIIPPRPPGYRENRELFPGYTGSTFDPLAAAESAANLTIGLILHPQRASRMVDYHSRDKNIPGLSEVLDRLIQSTWKSQAKQGALAEIQRVVNNVVMLNVMRLAVEESALPQVRAIAFLKLEDLKNWLIKDYYAVDDKDQKAHFFYAASQIKMFLENPSQMQLTLPRSSPPGAPIGMYSYDQRD
ncbi:MAG: zinc-dependent metalloprotease [Candidatus Aminicenantes bacterium]|nr:zinc-dependent metalloprotease [Candidatus Aminicenantes bacterium]